ncbi:inhibin beta chain [Biomphalaria pfeifferi]|uniref:Inhibin beta chain n=1 Tax=Biomphalaria pfeifferi TaxID=112525 RepID=A0AAD8EVW1_BIOPF|nr:inhibin beta chain [Biomphalaria pfeifferi]
MLRYLVFFCIVVALTFSGMRAETSNFTTSRGRNTSIALAIHAFGTKLLELLDLNNVTNATNISFPKVPEYVSSRLMADAEMTSDNVLSDDDESNMNKNTFTIYKPCNEYSSVYYINKSDSVFFSMPEMLAHQRVKSAKLMFYINAGNLTKHYLSLKVRRILLDNGVVQPRLVHSFTFLKSDAFGWKQIDVKDIVNDWQYHPLVEIGLQIEAKNEEGRNLVVLPADNFDKSYEPSLQIEVNKETSHSRHKRQISSPCPNPECCMYPYTIDLIETIGRSRGLEVVSPERLELNYCHGDCFYKRYEDFYYSALLINTQPVENPCCVPTKYKAMRIIYFVENQFADLNFPEAIVESCGCM